MGSFGMFELVAPLIFVVLVACVWAFRRTLLPQLDKASDKVKAEVEHTRDGLKSTLQAERDNPDDED